MAGWPAYDITTIRQPVEQMIDRTIAIVTMAADGDVAPRAYSIAGTLIERRSTQRSRTTLVGRGPGFSSVTSELAHDGHAVTSAYSSPIGRCK
jgi:hypothetical protein